MAVDSHHHLWRYSPAEYAWIGTGMEVLQRDYDEADLAEAARGTGVDATVVVQARQSPEENEALLEAARTSPLVAAVVGWVDLQAPDVERVLAPLADDPAFVGVRHIVQAEPDGFLDGTAFNAGIRALERVDLVYDILIYAPQLPEAIRFVDRHPRQRFVLDHLAKPAIRAAGFDETWAQHLRELARRPNVTAKISGLVTEVADSTWSLDLLRPYVEVALEAFGPARLLMGTDWPVCRLRAEYATWVEAVHALIAELSDDERHAILDATARRVYRLPSPAA
jgi:L-fuconolactonase